MTNQPAFKPGDIMVKGNVVAKVETKAGAEEFARMGWVLAETQFSEHEIFGEVWSKTENKHD